MDTNSILLLLVSLFIGWNIGANDAANCMGTSVGSGILNYKKAAILVSIFALIGAFLQGGNTIKTVGKGIVDTTQLTYISLFAALLGAALLVTYFTSRGIPISTTHAVIGAIAGIGIVTQITVSWGLLGKMLIYWIISPFAAVIFSFIAYKLLERAFLHAKLIYFERYLNFLVLLSGIFLAYSLGANNVGNAMGLVVSTKIITPVIAGFIGGLAISLGSATFGKKVMKTVGSGITEIDSRMAFAAQMGAGLAVYLLTAISIPTSTSHTIVGGIAGVGLVKGLAMIDKKQITSILRGWFLTPLLSSITAIILYFIFQLFI